MNTRQIIDRARALAAEFLKKEDKTVRLPVFAYEDWRLIYKKPDDQAAAADFRSMQRQNFYLMHFLVAGGAQVLPVPVRPDEFLSWAEASGHDLSDGHGLAHAVGEYVNRKECKPSLCNHAEYFNQLIPPSMSRLGTITVFGEREEEPEVMTVVIHGPDGEVFNVLEILADEHTPQEAWEKASEFLDQFHPEQVFQDRTIRRPEFCTDCNALQVSVASPEDVSKVRGG